MSGGWLQVWTAVVIGLAVAGGVARLAWRRRSAPPEARGPRWRLTALIVLQAAAGGLLYLTLFPPALPLRAGALVVATAGAPRTVALNAGDVLVALPEAPAVEGAARVPDLATALRRHPEAARVRVIGQGLPPRDHATLPIPVAFEPSAAPRGLTDVAFPAPVAPGAAFSAGGQVGAAPTGSVELVDPGNVVVDRARVAAGRRFVLSGAARAAGPALFELRLRDADGALVERVAVPVDVREPPRPRVRVLAGAPSAETRHLRRWAEDADVMLDLRIDLGGGARVGDAPGPSTGDLGEVDLLVVDDRAWDGLDPAERAAIASAVDGGLGLLLRPSGPLSGATRRDWAALGAPLAGEGGRRAVRLGAPAEPPAPRPDGEGSPEMARRDLILDGPGAISLIRGADGAPIAGWSARRRGRIGVWTLADSYVLVLTGDPAAHGRLWSDLFSTLARPVDESRVRVEGPALAGRRFALCGVSPDSRIVDPAGAMHTLLIDPAAGDEGCAAYWPERAGWHMVRDADAETPVYVHPADAAPSLRASADRRATLSLAGGKPASASADGERPGPSWPWFLGLLAALAALWTLERRSPGPPAAAIRSG